VRSIHVHDKYFDSDSYTYNYDVCLLETDDLGIDGNTVDVACLPNQGEHVNPTSGTRGPNVEPPNPKPNGRVSFQNSAQKSKLSSKCKILFKIVLQNQNLVKNQFRSKQKIVMKIRELGQNSKLINLKYV